MSLKIYNTASRQKEEFEPLLPNQVKMYVCGPTVYNLVHIGNARPVVVFDTLFRVLRYLFDDVVYARNITDIDDKIMKAAADNGEEISVLAARYAAAYEQDMAQLNALPPSIVPYATEHLVQMVDMIQGLVDKGHAYISEQHVLFDVKSMKDYGKLSNRSLDDMLDGARVEVAAYKRYGGDFILWKPSNDNEPGWESPWGRGRPGWHLECSAMIEKHLGNTIDIHGGGRDLIFPHHENELAQSECAHGGEQYVKYWMHNGYLNIDGEKMSKSLGNFRTVRELLDSYRGEVIRFALLSAQYRSELDFSASLLEQSKASLDSLYGAIALVNEEIFPEKSLLESNPGYLALMDDLNTPMAISELHQLAKHINKADDHNSSSVRKAKGMMLALANLMGILQEDAQIWFQGAGEDDNNWIEQMIEARQQAKMDKQYARADEIRDELKGKGILLEDSPSGTRWKKG